MIKLNCIMANINSQDKVQGVLIDIQRMKEKQKKLLEDHVKKHPKDHAPKIKLKKRNSKIKSLESYARKQEAKKVNKK